MKRLLFQIAFSALASLVILWCIDGASTATADVTVGPYGPTPGTPDYVVAHYSPTYVPMYHFVKWFEGK